jgi:protein-S-isoprenylcysteine O-methyltransferase Ste14
VIATSFLMFGIFCVLLAASAAFYFAASLAIYGNAVAGDICLTGGAFRQHPEYLAFAAVGAAVLWFATRE